MSFALENCYRVFETKTLQKPSKWLHEHIQVSLSSPEVIELKRDGLESIYLYRGRQIYFLGKAVKEIDNEKVVTQPVSNIWTDIPTNNLKDEGRSATTMVIQPKVQASFAVGNEQKVARLAFLAPIRARCASQDFGLAFWNWKKKALPLTASSSDVM
jgi:hypothetical protein